MLGLLRPIGIYTLNKYRKNYNQPSPSMKPQLYQFVELEYDSEGYVRSFDVNTATNEELSRFYQKYGVLVFRNVINQQQINKTIDDLWNSTISYYKELRNKQIKRDDPKTWDYLRGFQKAFGFVNDSILEEPQIWENRRNETIYKCFKRSYEASSGKPLTEPLISNFDRGSLMLPSKLNPQWRTQDIYHFDIDPWLWTGLTHNRYTQYDYDPDRMALLLGQGNYDPFVGYTKLAGVLALSDTNETSGGFQCACGFQNYIKQWCQSHKLYTSIESDQKLLKNFRKIFARKGSLMIFSRELPHNIYQNDSANFRYAQYLRMSPLSALCLTPELLEARKSLVKMILPKSLNVSDPISKQVFMLEPEQTQPVQQEVMKNEEIKNDKKGSPATNSQKKSQKSSCSIQ